MFLPTTKKEMQERGWDQLDIILISGDAYIDHASFGVAIIGRHLESVGYRVGIIAQPDWKKNDDFAKLGKPKLFFGVTAGNLDSIVNHYTAQRKLRSEDAFSPDGKIGLRPNLPSIVYTQKIKQLFNDVPVILGGVGASTRRLVHYDYYSDKIRNSILFDSKADILVYGMGEHPVMEIAHQLASEKDISELSDIKGTVVITNKPTNNVFMPEYHKNFSKEEFYQTAKIFEDNYREKAVYQKYLNRYLKHNPPSEPLTQEEMDSVYALPFERKPHPMYEGKKLAAFEQIKNSVTSHRGCFGGCAFCAIGYHQGKTISSRSQKSVANEIAEITKTPGFHGTISDVGGPSANMYGMYCKEGISQVCKRRSCLFPDICPNLETSHQPNLKLLKYCSNIKNVDHLFIASGIRFDLALNEDKYIKQIAQNYISGLLKLAPEHINITTLKAMNKPSFDKYQEFGKKFGMYSELAGKNQSIVPYMIVGHPGSDLRAAIELAIYLKRNNIRLRQIQEFTPTAMTESTLAYVTGKTLSGNKVHVPRGREIRLQKALVQWYDPKNKKLIIEALKMAGRMDLLDFFFGKIKLENPEIKSDDFKRRRNKSKKNK
ncbi:MAG: YgiQ family radical SAM protein [Candidatus Cloacimonetes bacterium]|nr:YgiQ family radical SAM protein [Candidatus Cloacimonadota bacterium]